MAFNWFAILILLVGGLAVAVAIAGTVWLFVRWIDRDRKEPPD